MLSLHPRHAQNVFSGHKTVELRRLRGRVGPGDTVLIYVSSPVKALVGSCSVSRVLYATPDRLWTAARFSTGLSRREFDTYFAGSVMGFAIFLGAVERYAEPVPLELVRQHLPDFHPPQTYLYLSADATQDLRSLVDVHNYAQG